MDFEIPFASSVHLRSTTVARALSPQGINHADLRAMWAALAWYIHIKTAGKWREERVKSLISGLQKTFLVKATVH